MSVIHAESKTTRFSSHMAGTDSMIGAVLAHRYRIDAPLGGGSGNSDVFEATDIRSRKNWYYGSRQPRHLLT